MLPRSESKLVIDEFEFPQVEKDRLKALFALKAKADALPQREILALSNEEKEKRIALYTTVRAEEARLRALLIEEEKTRTVYATSDGLLRGFDTGRIPDYCRYGIHVDYDYYAVGAPEIINPHYMSLSAVNSYLFDSLGHNTVDVRQKWDGVKVQVLTLTSASDVCSIWVIGSEAFFDTHPYKACQFEMLDNDFVVTSGDVKEKISPTSTNALVGPRADGLIILTDTADYRVKVSRSYDLAVRNGKLVDKEGKVYADTKLPEGTIVETDDKFRPIKIREDKTYPLSTNQVDQVTYSVVTGALPSLILPGAVRVTAPIAAEAHRTAAGLMGRELFWTQDAVGYQLRKQCGSGYTKEEIYSCVAPVVAGAHVTEIKCSVGPTKVWRTGSTLFFQYPKLRKLTVRDFLEAYAEQKALGKTKKKLLDLGFVFTPNDIQLVREVYLRGLKNEFVPNVGFSTYCKPAWVECMYNVDDNPTDLPYIKVARAGSPVKFNGGTYSSGFSLCPPSKELLTLKDMSELPAEVYYSDLLELSERTGRVYDEGTIGIGLKVMGKTLIGARPWRMPTLSQMVMLARGRPTVRELADKARIPIPYLTRYIDQNQCTFRVSLEGLVEIVGDAVGGSESDSASAGS